MSSVVIIQFCHLSVYKIVGRFRMCKPDPLNCDHCDTASHGELPVDKLLRVQKCKVHRSVWFSSSWFGIKVCSRSTKSWLLESHLSKGKSDRPLTKMYNIYDTTFWHMFPWQWCQKFFSYKFVWGHVYSLERCGMEWNVNLQLLICCAYLVVCLKTRLSRYLNLHPLQSDVRD